MIACDLPVTSSPLTAGTNDGTPSLAPCNEQHNHKSQARATDTKSQISLFERQARTEARVVVGDQMGVGPPIGVNVEAGGTGDHKADFLVDQKI